MSVETVALIRRTPRRADPVSMAQVIERIYAARRSVHVLARTCALRAMLRVVALALGGRAGARLTGRLGTAIDKPQDQVVGTAGQPDRGWR